MLNLNMVRNFMLAIAGASGLTLGVGHSVQAATLTFDELPYQPVNGLPFSGVTFGFTVNGVASGDAYYNYNDFPAVVTYLQGATLEGSSAGILSLDFADPVASLQFGVNLQYLGPLTPGFTVSLFDSTLALLSTSAINTNSLISFTEGLFSYNGTPVQRAAIEFNQSQAPRFALDNLTFEPAQSQAVPEPATMGGILLALGGMAGARSRLRKKAQDLP